jgi:hypothetical protein
MKKQFLLLIFSLTIASVLAETEFGDCPNDIAENCLKLAKSKCCGTKGNICCSEDEYYNQFPKFEDAKAEPRGMLKGIAKLIGFIVGAIIFVVVVCCVCCFCCPFCLFSKHRNGRVIRRNDEQAQNQEQQGLQQQQQQQPQVSCRVKVEPMEGSSSDSGNCSGSSSTASANNLAFAMTNYSTL